MNENKNKINDGAVPCSLALVIAMAGRAASCAELTGQGVTDLLARSS
ncbi:hypothetical protein ITJ57_09905 [Plantibacter sp. VKM Ac-2880]|nr:hypothetical protein [Plantibacter sp. VKM Ac-2880]MBF4569077.1 hypothetical protein [Plantibacter sp. VKM Ac-2880]